MENNILENMDSILFAVILLYFFQKPQNKNRHASLKPAWRLHFKWWPRRDSNPRPFGS